jgi:hypothetical protein
MYLGALDYMCMALSIFLAPKKEVFIWCFISRNIKEP